MTRAGAEELAVWDPGGEGAAHGCCAPGCGRTTGEAFVYLQLGDDLRLGDPDSGAADASPRYESVPVGPEQVVVRFATSGGDVEDPDFRAFVGRLTDGVDETLWIRHGPAGPVGTHTELDLAGGGIGIRESDAFGGVDLEGARIDEIVLTIQSLSAGEAGGCQTQTGVDASVTLIRLPLPVAGFIRGDSNGDGEPDISDAVFSLSYLFLGGRAPPSLAAADSNGDDEIDISDPTYLLNFLFLGGPAPPSPFPVCGFSEDPGDITLDCIEPLEDCA
jgi:hypothetical protein